MTSFRHISSSYRTLVSILAGVLIVIIVLFCQPLLSSADTAIPKYPTTICVDPGHPSEVSAGRAVQNGLQEAAINWQVAQYLIQDLKQMGYNVECTKTCVDERVTNRHRAEIANESGASLLIRLHCDTGGGSGYTLYYPNRQGRKNGKTGPPPYVIKSSAAAAKAVHKGMAAKLKGVLRDNGVKGDTATRIGSKQGALTGSIYSLVPTVTVEMVFLSNKANAGFIGTEKGRMKMAAALAKGISEYLPLRYSQE